MAQQQLDHARIQHLEDMNRHLRSLAPWFKDTIASGLCDCERESPEGREIAAEYGARLFDRYMDILNTCDAFTLTSKCYDTEHQKAS